MQSIVDNYPTFFHYRRGTLRRIGVEGEHPVANTRNHGIFDVPKLYPVFLERGWQPEYDDVHADVLSAVCDDEGRWLGTDAGVTLLEYALPHEASLHDIQLKHGPWVEDVRNTFRAHGGLVLDTGIHPVSRTCRWAKKFRYELLKIRVGEGLNAITVAASSQVHVDVAPDELVPALNVFNGFSGVYTALMGNSGIRAGRRSRYLAVRETFYPTFAPERSGMLPSPVSDIESYVSLMEGLPLLLTKHDEEYVLPEEQSLAEFTKRHPQTLVKDWEEQERCTWWQARARIAFGTIEVRTACTQPFDDWLVVAALTLGLAENLSEADELRQNFRWQAWKRFHRDAIQKGLAAKLDNHDAAPVIRDVLDIAEAGLKQRGLQEEMFLEPLRERLEERKNPAQRSVDVFLAGGEERKERIEALIKHIS